MNSSNRTSCGGGGHQHRNASSRFFVLIDVTAKTLLRDNLQVVRRSHGVGQLGSLRSDRRPGELPARSSLRCSKLLVRGVGIPSWSTLRKNRFRKPIVNLGLSVLSVPSTGDRDSAPPGSGRSFHNRRSRFVEVARDSNSCFGAGCTAGITGTARRGGHRAPASSTQHENSCPLLS